MNCALAKGACNFVGKAAPLRFCIRNLSVRARRSVQQILTDATPAAGSEDARITSEGWIKAIRKTKKTTFFHLEDGSSIQGLQVVVADDNLRNLPLTFGSAVSVTGNLVASPAARQSVELVAESIKIVQENDHLAYPFKIKETHQPEVYREHLHLRPRAERFASMMRMRSAATMAIHEFFQEKGFVLVHTPILTGNDCEGGGEAFHVQSEKGDGKKKTEEFFGRPTVLTVSGQLHLEAAACALKRVYNVNPAFRAERQLSRRHLSEFWMVEAEVAFIDELDHLLQLMESLLKDITRNVLKKAPADFAFHMANVAEENHETKIVNMLENEFRRVTYGDALQILNQHRERFHNPPKDGDNLHRDHELFLVEHFGNLPLFITHFPVTCKPFYARIDDANPFHTLSADLIVPAVGELFGGSLREHRYDVIASKCGSGTEFEALKWYADLRRFGGPPCGGFGMGFERYLQYLLGISSIKDAIPFPRWLGHCDM
ncbi:putative asparagine--tRNA ligase, mitochondrial [Hypsibius exemplaris]|uniref:asparagine--tRNA ligase n=1 Tax=Hypsibius exemplaris TaxID=2072580 RepID=A0A9X6NGM1_HYPEX|nr:putative asparagine--tRNA ligase, mitochondrial [Hypsibius exemplaris]